VPLSLRIKAEDSVKIEFGESSLKIKFEEPSLKIEFEELISKREFEKREIKRPIFVNESFELDGARSGMKENFELCHYF